MAVTVLQVTLGNALPNNEYNASANAALADPVAALTLAAAKVVLAQTASDAVVAAAVTVAAALAVCVADGASPTQAHVTTLNNAYTTLASAITTCDVAVDLAVTDTNLVSLAGDAVILVDRAVVTTGNKFRAVINAALQAAKNSGIL